MIYSLTQLQQLAASVGFPDPALAAAVAMAESGGNSQAHGDLQYGGDGSIGLWQIFTVAHPQYTSAELYDPVFNAKVALATSQNGKNWNPWTTYRDGAYRRWYSGPLAGSSSFWEKALLTAAALTVAGAAAVLVYDVVHNRPVFAALRS